jgi:hypothetical protein
MRAKEFIIEAPVLSAAELAAKTKAATSSNITSQSPSQLSAQQSQQQQQQRLAGLGATAQTKTGTPGQKPQGFLGGLAQGFKQGIGVNPDQSLATGLAGKALDKVGMRATSDAITDPTLQKGSAPETTDDSGQPVAPPKVGTMIKDPRFGNVKILPNAPGQKGIHLDTTKTLGHPIYIDPRDLQR